MCPPLHFGVLYEINPWMHREVAVDIEGAAAQWEALAANLRGAGAVVETIEPQPHVPDLVFTANAGLVRAAPATAPGTAAGAGAGAGQFVPSHFRYPQRQPETEVFTAWFAARGWRVDHLPVEVDHEGAGDALPFGGTLLSGYRPRSDASAGPVLSRLLGTAVRSVELVDERLYHVDLTFCPLDDRRAICAPLGWDRYGRRVVEELVPEPLWLEDDEAMAFCANSVVVGTNVVMPSVPTRVGRRLEGWGFDVVESPVGEFLKAGGGCRCLTLALDVDLGPA